MPRRPAPGLRTVAMLGPLLLPIGCGTGPAPSSAPATGPSYGENKLPPPEQVAPKKGMGARSTGAPPLAR